MIAGRLSEDPNVKILVLEAGKDSADMDNMHMAGACVLDPALSLILKAHSLTAPLTLCSWTMNHKGETDWNIMTPPNPGLDGREIHVPRGRFLGGSSGCNGTICVRGVKQDYDDWGFPEWSGDEMFRAMKKVCLLGMPVPPPIENRLSL